MSRRIPAAAAAGAALLLAAPAAASAVTASVNQPCYSHVPTRGSEPIVVTLAGGTPGAQFLVAATQPGKGSGSAGSAGGAFDAAGNGTAQITDVSPPSGTIGPTKGQKVLLSVKDFGAGGTEVSAGQALITNTTMSVARTPSSPHARRRVSVSGTPFAGKRLYGFVVKPNSSKVLRRLALGKANACGFTSAAGVVAPQHFALGTYRLYVNAGKTLNKARALAYSFKIFRRVF